MSNNLTLALRILGDSSSLQRGLTQSSSSIKRFSGFARREIESLKTSFNSLTGKLASLGVSLSVAQQVMMAARLDQSLIRIGQTAGASQAQVIGLRAELFQMAQQTGNNVEDLQQGFNNLVQSGMSWDAARATIKDVNAAMAVTGAEASTLSGALGVAAQAFDFDLSKPGMALKLLDKMTVAGRLGNAELEDLSGVFSRIGVNAKAAGMNFDQTLAFTETLSMVERMPERLATLADSTLRLFNNANYRKETTKATGVQFFNKDGTRRAANEVLQDIKTKYDKLTSDKGRATFLSAAFGKADLDTQKGMLTLLSGDMLTKSEAFGKTIADASGTLKNDMSDALNNAVSQTGRLKAALRSAADEFVKPINKTLSNAIQWAMDKKENGGLGADGKDMMLGGAVLAAGTFAAARYGSMGIKAVADKFGGVGVGVATGKALEAAAGVTPVYVVNMPGGLAGGASVIPGAPGGAVADAASTAGGVAVASKLKSMTTGLKLLTSAPTLASIASFGAAATAIAAAMVAGAGAVGYGVGTLAYNEKIKDTEFGDNLGGMLATIWAGLGSKEAQQAIEVTLHLDGQQINAAVESRQKITNRRN